MFLVNIRVLFGKIRKFPTVFGIVFAVLSLAVVVTVVVTVVIINVVTVVVINVVTVVIKSVSFVNFREIQPLLRSVLTVLAKPVNPCFSGFQSNTRF